MTERFIREKQLPFLINTAQISARLLGTVPGIHKVSLFGSVLRGNIDEASDVDLGIIYDGGANAYDTLILRARQLLEENDIRVSGLFGCVHLEAFSDSEYVYYMNLNPKDRNLDRTSKFLASLARRISKGRVLFP